MCGVLSRPRRCWLNWPTCSLSGDILKRVNVVNSNAKRCDDLLYYRRDILRAEKTRFFFFFVFFYTFFRETVYAHETLWFHGTKKFWIFWIFGNALVKLNFLRLKGVGNSHLLRRYSYILLLLPLLLLLEYWFLTVLAKNEIRNNSFKTRKHQLCFYE